MACRDNHGRCHDTNGHGHEYSATVGLLHSLDEKAPFTVPSSSTFGASCKSSSNTPLVWCFQSQLLRPQSAQPTRSEQICDKPRKAYKNSPPQPDEADGTADSPQSDKTTICNSSILCSLISDLEEDSIVTEVSSVSMRPSDWSSSSQPTTKLGQSHQPPENFKATILQSTLNLMKYRLNYPLLLAKSRHLTGNQALSNCEQSLGSFAEDVLRKRADRQPPNAVAKPSALDAALWYIKHQWKCRYYTLLDAVDLLYKDYQLLHHVSADQNQRSHHVTFPQRLLSSYSVDNIAVGNDRSTQIGVLAGADPVTHLANRIAEHTVCPQAHVWPHRFNASVCFILDVIAQCRLLRVQSDKMTAFRDRAFRLTTEAREQRDRLRKYMAEQRTAIAEVAKALTEVRERITRMQRGPPVEIRRKQSLSQEELNVMEIQEQIAHQRSQLSVLETILREEEAKRRYMHNRLQEITGNIRVLCRVRPHSPSRKHPIDYLKVTSNDKLLLCPNDIPEVLLGRASTILKSLKSTTNPDGFKCFIFDRVFGPDAQQQAVYKEVDDSIISCVDGFNVCIMAYGQTGSGKTHTMVGSAQDPGVNRRAIQRLLQPCKSRKHWTYQLSMSMLEVYQEEVFDLLVGGAVDKTSGGDCVISDCKSARSVDLSTNSRQLSPTGFMTTTSGNSFAQPRPSQQRRLSMVRLLSTREDELVLQNLTEKIIGSEEDMLQLLALGERRRSTGATRLNTNSSRSHVLLLLRVTGEHTVNKTQSRGTLILADLAGSENVSKSGSVGRRFQEATCINKSLSCLARVFDSLRKRLKPAYRETKLTYLLKPTLGGDAKCLVLVNVRSEPENLDETLRAIQFGHGALQVAPWKSSNLGAPQNVGVRCSRKPRCPSHVGGGSKACVRRHTKTSVL